MDWDIVSGLVKAVELKDDSTAAHTWRVALYTQALAEAAGKPADEVHRLMKAAVLHDVGKIEIPAEILTKPARLTDAEYTKMKTHAAIGHEQLRRMGETDETVLGLVRWHHERLDGSGYPDRLTGREIPPAAKCFAVIDSFDAMTSIRPYRRSVGQEAAALALLELKQKSGTWYCPECVDLLNSLFQTGSLNFILEHFNDESTQALSVAPDPVTIAAVTKTRVGRSSRAT